MRIDPVSILIDQDTILKKKFYFISGNEYSLIEKVSETIVEKYTKDKNFTKKKITSIENFLDEGGLFEDKKIFVGKNCKGIDYDNLNKVKNISGDFIFIQENSSKIRKLKEIFLKDKNSYLIDCYELDKDSKIKILNTFINKNKIKIEKEIYWLLIDKLDATYSNLENNLSKILELNHEDITFSNIKKILTTDDVGKEKIFFNLLKKNNKIIELYKDKITTSSDVNDFFYHCRFFCQLIIECKNEEDYKKRIPIYLFKEKSFLIDVYKKYNLRKRKLLLTLLSSTEKALRQQGNLSLMYGLRFFLNIKKITIS